jgi:hypothetical protein
VVRLWVMHRLASFRAGGQGQDARPADWSTNVGVNTLYKVETCCQSSRIPRRTFYLFTGVLVFYPVACDWE